jgi:nucleoid-associated protein
MGMAYTIQAGIIHQIKKEQNTKGSAATLQLQEALHSNNEHLKNFVEYAEQQLQKSGRNSSISGGFGIQNTLSKALADDYFSTNDQIDYLLLSKEIAKGLFHFVTKKSATTGEYVPMIFYRDRSNTDYLLLSLISLNKYININTNGEFSNTSVIDNDALKVGLKINLVQMALHHANPNDPPQDNYIQWIQRGSSKLPEYIQEFVPVSEQIDNGKTTNLLLQSVMNYTESTFDDLKTRQKVETDITTLMRTKLDQGEPVHIEEDIDKLLDTALTTHGLNDKPKFNEYRQTNNIVLDSSFRVDGQKLQRYEKFDLSLAEKGITIKGTKSEIGESIKAVTIEEDKYLQIKISDDEYTELTTRYKALVQ